MKTKSVGIPEFRAGLAEADLHALREAADKLEAVMSLSEDDVDAAARDFDKLRKDALARRRAQA